MPEKLETTTLETAKSVGPGSENRGKVTCVDLNITGMTCSACVGRVEKKLSKLPGVKAVVNLALESATVSIDPQIGRSANGQPLTVDDLIATVEKAGYGATLKTEDDPARNEDTERTQTFLAHFWVSLVLAVPIVLISMIPAWHFPYWGLVVALLTTPLATWAAWPFHKAAASALRHGSATMDTLVSLGVIVSYISSLGMLIMAGIHGDLVYLPGMHLYFETAAMIVSFLLLGRYFEAKSRKKAGTALKSLLNLAAKEVELVDGRIISVKTLKVGDKFRVRTGQKIATDGVVTSGTGAVDASLLTGESLPVDVQAGSNVAGGTILTAGALTVEATQIGENTLLAQITNAVTQTQALKPPVQRIADRIAGVFVPIVVGISIATAVIWTLATGGSGQALTAAIAVLVVACPCALGLATPTAILVGSGRAASLGSVVRTPEVFEAAGRVTAAVFDKTGTLTDGKAAVIGSKTAAAALAAHFPAETDYDSLALVLAASAEAGSAHPLALALQEAAKARSLDLLATDSFTTLPGQGVTASLAAGPEGSALTLYVGKPSWLPLSPDLERAASELSGQGCSLVALAITTGGVPQSPITDDLNISPATLPGYTPVAVFGIRDNLKPGARELIADLAKLGINSYLLTGDNEQAARTIGAQLGLPEKQVRAEVTPLGKADTIKELQASGAQVAMIGDGINDAAALAQSDLAIAMGSGTDTAISAGDLVLLNPDITQLTRVFTLVRKCLRVIKQNLAWAFGYNFVMIPLAAGGILPPGLAAFAMASSSVIVVTNSLRLRTAG